MRAVYLVYCVSGFVSLSYQVAWFRVFVDRFGSTNLTFGLVLVNFIGGLGAGSLASRRLAGWLRRRTGLSDGLRVYGLVEMLVAVCVLLTVLSAAIPSDAWGSFPYVSRDGVFERTAVYAVWHILIGTVCVFVPCFLMGVTFPLLCSVFGGHGRFPAALYGWNTLGACGGVLACEFLFLPYLGHTRILFVMAAVNFAVGMYFVRFGGRVDLAVPTLTGPSAPRKRVRGRAASRRETTEVVYPVSVAVGCAVISGLLAGALEADLFKRLGFLGCRSAAAMSFISFWAILAIFLASWTVRALPRLGLVWIKLAFVVALAFFLLTWRHAYSLVAWANAGALAATMNAAASKVGSGEDAVYEFYYFMYGLRPTLLFTGVFVFPVFYLLSLLLPHVCNAVQAGRRHLGVVYGLNTVAFCVGMFGFTWLAPRVNIFYSLKLFTVLFIVLVLLLMTIRAGRGLGAWRPAVAALAFVVGCAATSAEFDPHLFDKASAPARYPVRAMKSDASHTTFVVEEPGGDRLYFGSHSMSGTDLVAQQYMRLMAHFPLLAHPHPTDALLVCFGVGNTASAIACHDTIERIDVVDLSRKVLETAPEFAKYNHDVIADSRIRLIHDDGRSFLSLTDRKYDLITSEPPPPMHQGVYRLYSEEYYASVRAHLTSQGMMTQWFPVAQMPRRAVELALGTFVDAFPHVLLICGSGQEYVGVGSMAPIDLAAMEDRFDQNPRVVEDMAGILVPTPVELFARIVQGDRTVRREWGGFPSIGDQRNDLAYLGQDPADPVVIRYNPLAVLAETDASRLAVFGELRGVVTNLGQLKTRLRDFPDSALMTIRNTGAEGIRLSDVDWDRVGSLYQVALRSLREDRLDAAARYARLAVRETDQLPYLLSLLGRLETSRGQHESALSCWDRFLALSPGDVAGYHGKALSLLRLGRYADALAASRGALELDENNSLTHKLLGDVFAASEDWGAAVRAYDRALALDPSDEVARHNRVLVAIRNTAR